MTRDQNGNTISRSVRKESDGSWGSSVWFGRGCVTNVSRYYYRTRREASDSDISDYIGKRGRVK